MVDLPMAQLVKEARSSPPHLELEHMETSRPQPSLLASTLLANQIPPICNFTGEDEVEIGGPFQGWKAQFEIVAALAGWTNERSWSTSQLG